MAQLNFSLPDIMKAKIDDIVAQGAYASASDYLRDLVRRDEERAERIAALREALQYGRDSGRGMRSLQEIHADNRARRNAA